MATTYMFNKSNRKCITSIQRQALCIIQSFFSLRVNSGESQLRSQTKGAPDVRGVKIGNNPPIEVLLGKPLFTVTPNKVTVQLFYHGNSPISNDKLSSLGTALTQLPWPCSSHLSPLFKGGAVTNQGYKLELQVIRLNYSVLDSSIFAQYLTYNASKYSFNRILDILKNTLPIVDSDGSLDESLGPTSHITGIKVKLSGRLTTQQSGPRQTIQAGRIGSSAKGPYATADYSQHTSKNKLGAFTMKV